MAVHGRAELLRRIEHVLRYSPQGAGDDAPVFGWACALHGGTYHDAEAGRRDCWLLTTRFGETLPLTREALLALDATFPTDVPHAADRALWLMGAVPCSLEPPAIAMAGHPLSAIELRLYVGPNVRALAHLHADIGTTLRPHDCWQPLVLASAAKPPGVPR